ncbi:hypothetical protein [Amycolatopsis taiwanensis]|uniref:hypothetical protein n=1 Tax=Amycolatopsis taiwanensis TaxID=342230 RepID=UPI0025536EA4|nr:hypothetical protein [Amycolatopsis taiwanensis]
MVKLPERAQPGNHHAGQRHLRPVRERPWPPAFFASAPGDGVSIAEQAGELLREGFGR